MSAVFAVLVSTLEKLAKSIALVLISVTTDKVQRRKSSAPQASTVWVVSPCACLVTLVRFKMKPQKLRAKSAQKAGRTALELRRHATSAHPESTLPSMDQKNVTSVRSDGSKLSLVSTTARHQRRVRSLVVMVRLKSALQVDGTLPSATRTASSA
jgi:hypothetical protein